MRVPCAPLRLHVEGSACGPHCHSKAWGEKSVGGGGAILVTNGISSGLCRPVLAQTGLGVESER
jgi:hypothetical protein